MLTQNLFCIHRTFNMCSETILASQTWKNMILIKVRSDLISRTSSFIFGHGLRLLSEFYTAFEKVSLCHQGGLRKTVFPDNIGIWVPGSSHFQEWRVSCIFVIITCL